MSWSSKKQPTVAMSSMEAEYIALSHATKEAIWLRSLLIDLGLSPAGATTIYCDNQAAIALSHDFQFHAKSKHIDIQHHFIRDKVNDKSISISYVPTNENPADILTKGLARPKHEKFGSEMGLLPS